MAHRDHLVHNTSSKGARSSTAPTVRGSRRTRAAAVEMALRVVLVGRRRPEPITKEAELVVGQPRRAVLIGVDELGKPMSSSAVLLTVRRQAHRVHQDLRSWLPPGHPESRGPVEPVIWLVQSKSCLRSSAGIPSMSAMTSRGS